MFLLGFMTPFHLFSATRECPASPAGTGKGRQQTEAPEQLLSLMAEERTRELQLEPSLSPVSSLGAWETRGGACEEART